MAVLSAIWRRLVWCSLIGGGLGIGSGLIDMFKKGQWSGFDLFFDIIVGTLWGVVVLGTPATLWTIGRAIFHREKAAPVTSSMVGSTAAVPGAIAGALVGAALGGLGLYLLFVLMIFTTIPWYDQVVKHYLIQWFCWFCGIGAGIGSLAGLFLGSAFGAIWGRLRRSEQTQRRQMG